MEARSEDTSFAIVRAWTEAGPPRTIKVRVLTSGALDGSLRVIGVADDIDQACLLVKAWLTEMPAVARGNTRSERSVDDDLEQLRTLNVEVGEAESEGDAGYFEELLAPVFAMRRADGTMADRDSFIEAVRRSPPRDTEIETITLLPLDRAIVACIVTVHLPEGPQRFHNARLFMRASSDCPWRLLAWANERLT